MILFWSLAALMIGAAVALVAIPLLRGGSAKGVDRDQLNVAVHRDRLAELEAERAEGSLDEALYAQAKEELERDLLTDVTGAPKAAATARGGRWGALVAALLVPLLAVNLYFQFGMPQAIEGPPNMPQTPEGMPSINEMLATLEQRLASQPENLQGWLMLGRSYAALDRYPEAAKAYGRAYDLKSDDIEITLLYAEAMANAQGGTLAGEPAALVEKALASDGGHPTALWLAGIARMQREDYPGAVAHWDRLFALQAPGSEGYKVVLEALTEARSLAGMEPPVVAEAPKAAAGPSVTVSVDISDEMAKAAGIDDTLFIYARAAQGPKAPLAMVKRKVADLPLTVTLDDSMAMVPGMNLSAFPEVVIYARVSKSGQATAEPGDLEGSSAPLVPAEGAAATVTIDRAL